MMKTLRTYLALLAAVVAELGENPDWVVANAHCWFAAFLMLCFHGNIFAALALVALAACKEFIFDAKYETHPKQTPHDNWMDFAEYFIGIVIGFAVSHLI